MTLAVLFRRPRVAIPLVLVCLALVFFAGIRPWYLTWGSTSEERSRTMPGDSLVPNADGMLTRAVVIHAPAKDVWPWLVQIGYGRAGWYNLDWLNRMLGAADFVDGHRSANRIIPALQNLKVGDRILMVPQTGWRVAALDPEQYLVLQGDGSTMTLILAPVNTTTTRLITRNRSVIQGSARFIFAVLEPGIFIQESRFMLGVKERAERLYNLNKQAR